MTVNLTPQESLDYFYNSLCNGLGYFGQYGLELDWDENEYQSAKAKLKEAKTSICFEDILIQILKDGGTLTFHDTEGGEEDANLTLQMVYDRVNKTPQKHLWDAINENDDAITADVIIQTVLFDEVIYG